MIGLDFQLWDKEKEFEEWFVDNSVVGVELNPANIIFVGHLYKLTLWPGDDFYPTVFDIEEI